MQVEVGLTGLSHHNTFCILSTDSAFLPQMQRSFMAASQSTLLSILASFSVGRLLKEKLDTSCISVSPSLSFFCGVLWVLPFPLPVSTISISMYLPPPPGPP